MLHLKLMHLKYWNRKNKSTIYLNIKEIKNWNIKEVRNKPTISLEQKHREVRLFFWKQMKKI